MKLSMWMLAERLSQYDIRCNIKDGHTNISGIRFIVGDLVDFSSEYLYIGHAMEVFSDLQYRGNMVLSSGNDLMFVKDITAEALLNEILLSFEMYNTWEAKLMEASYGSNSLQNMIKTAIDVLHFPMVIFDTEGNVIVYSENFTGKEVGSSWYYMIQTMMVPVSANSSTIITSNGEKWEKWDKTPRQYVLDDGMGYIAANLYVDDELVGAFFMLGYNHPFFPHHCQLAEKLCTIVVNVVQKKSEDCNIRSNTSIFRSLLEGEAVDAHISDRLNTCGWSEPWNLIVIKLLSAEATELRKSSVLNTIRNIKVNTISMRNDGMFYVLVDSANLKKFLLKFENYLTIKYFSVGVSLQIEDLSLLPEALKQANFSLAAADGVQGVYHCEDYAYEHMLSKLVSLNKTLPLTHPAPAVLRQHDQSQSMDLYKTLYVFLTNDRNIAASSKVLGVHRNTLIYRLNKITELTGIDLDDADARVYIQISYKIDIMSNAVSHEYLKGSSKDFR